MTKPISLLCCSILLAPSLALAGIERAGTTSANFLSIGTGARALGMGGATLGLGGDLEASNWNPAALATAPGTELRFSHANLAEQSAQEWVKAGGRLGASPVRWALSGVFQSEGTFEGRDEFNNPTNTFNVSSMALGGQLAAALTENVSVGFAIKWANENLGPDLRGAGFTFDGGVRLQAGSFGVGLAGQNVGGSMRFSSQTYPFPTNIGVGVAYEHAESGLAAALDFNMPSAYHNDVRGGIEWRWRDHLALRTGYRIEIGAPSGDPLAGPSFGIGAGVRGVWVDYGYVISGGGEGRHRMGVSFIPGLLGFGSSPEQRRASRDWDPMRDFGPVVPPDAPRGRGE